MRIPPEFLPRDGRFGCGPSLVRPESLDRLCHSRRLGTSHRQGPVRQLVGSVRANIATLLGAPADYEVVLGNGGATAFWDAATFSLVERQAAHGTFGEFSAKFAKATDAAPFLAPSLITTAAPGGCALPTPAPEADVYAWAHNETSTGVLAPVRRIVDGPALTLIDATSAAGAVPFDPAATDVYYFSPQKNLGSEGGLWLALMSPRAIERVGKLAATDRWIPEFLSLQLAIENSRKDQTLNTPAIATLELLDAHLGWLLESGGLAWAAERTRESSGHLYAWAEAREFAQPFVADAALRSPVVVTIDLSDDVPADSVNAILRENGIFDTFAYRKLARNQLRIATFPAVDPADVRQLTRAIDYVVEQIR